MSGWEFTPFVGHFSLLSLFYNKNQTDMSFFSLKKIDELLFPRRIEAVVHVELLKSWNYLNKNLLNHHIAPGVKCFFFAA